MKHGKITGSTYELTVIASTPVAAYKAVTIVDGDINNEIVKIGLATAYTNSITGITTYNLSGQGSIITKGIVKNIPGFNTTLASMGDLVYSTNTGDLTLLTTDKVVGYVIALNGNGSIFVNPYYVPTANQNFKYLPLNVSTNNQTTFNMGITIPTPGNSILTINGGKQEYGNDYNIFGTTLTWLNNRYKLETTDILELYY